MFSFMSTSFGWELAVAQIEGKLLFRVKDRKGHTCYFPVLHSLDYQTFGFRSENGNIIYCHTKMEEEMTGYAQSQSSNFVENPA